MGMFLQANTWIALLTLAFLEIVLGIDNIVNEKPKDSKFLDE